MYQDWKMEEFLLLADCNYHMCVLCFGTSMVPSVTGVISQTTEWCPCPASSLLVLWDRQQATGKQSKSLIERKQRMKILSHNSTSFTTSGNQQDILYQGLVHCLPRTFARTFLTKVLVVLRGSQNIHRLQGKRPHWIALNLFCFFLSCAL